MPQNYHDDYFAVYNIAHRWKKVFFGGGEKGRLE